MRICCEGGGSIPRIIRASESLLAVISTTKPNGRTTKSRIVSRREADINECLADASKAKALFGWEVKLDIDRMCAEM